MNGTDEFFRAMQEGMVADAKAKVAKEIRELKAKNKELTTTCLRQAKEIEKLQKTKKDIDKMKAQLKREVRLAKLAGEQAVITEKARLRSLASQLLDYNTNFEQLLNTSVGNFMGTNIRWYNRDRIRNHINALKREISGTKAKKKAGKK